VSSFASDIAAQVTAELAAEGAAKGYALDRDAATDIEDLLAPRPAPVEPASQGAQRVSAPAPSLAPAAVVAEPEVAPVAEPPSIDFDPEVPDDVLELLEDDDDYDLPPAATTDDDDEPLAYEDELEKLRRENAKLAKKAAFADKQRAESQQAKWTAEANKFFPLSTPETIRADSRRGFLKAAREQHEAIKNNPKVREFLEQKTREIAAERAATMESARAEAQSAWGKPTAGPGLVPVQQGVDEEALQKARRSGNLQAVITAMRGGR
jgi:hypothetical protein